MSGWGRVSFLIGVGIMLGAGCGGRTGALDDFEGGDEGGTAGIAGSVPRAGATPVAGRSGRGGRGNAGGSLGTAASPSGGFAVGGGPSPGGGYGGTFAFGGTYTLGGYGGHASGGYGGYASGGYGGYQIGGYGGYQVGGYGGQGYASCVDCLRQACLLPLSQCVQDFGCLAIFTCMQTTRCQGLDCYSDDYCKGTIDQFGGPTGTAMGELLDTVSCAVRSGCPCN